MSKYTTGEIAKLCGVSVRTVQYYDSRGILVPSELIEGGRRLYSEADLGKMKIICFLRSLELPIDSIKDLFEQEDSEKIISIILDEQEKRLRSEIAQKQASAERIAEAKRTLRQMPQVSAESIGDIAHIMENKMQLYKLRRIMLILALPMNLIEISTIVLWVKTGMWVPYAVGMGVVAMMGAFISCYYFGSVCYICPNCHTIFKPSFREASFARHTLYTRKLTCPHCRCRGFCVETYGKDEKKC